MDFSGFATLGNVKLSNYMVKMPQEVPYVPPSTSTKILKSVNREYKMKIPE